jgi:hypothetical protein
LKTDGTGLDYSTLLGGTLLDWTLGIALDSSGNVYVTGFTESSDFPVTEEAFQQKYGGGNDIFVTKLNATGTAVSYSTYLGGNSLEEGWDIKVDSSGNAFVVGWTSSPDFQPTEGALQQTLNGPGDAVIVKLNTTGSVLYSTYFGGSGIDAFGGLSLSDCGNVYLAGATSSFNFPVRQAFQPQNNTNPGGGDLREGVITKLTFLSTMGVAPDATADGPLPVTVSQYQLPPIVDREVIDVTYDIGSGPQPLMVEMWASVYRPATLASGTQYPVLIFLHGNHSTCERNSTPSPMPLPPGVTLPPTLLWGYNLTGVCDDPYTSFDERNYYNVIQNHQGYDYLAQKLASWGYIVVSINVNRGVHVSGLPSGYPDPALILPRGRMVLRHLQRLSEWNAGRASFIPVRTLGASRNNASGWFGMRITVGPQPITLRSLGRMFIAGNSGTHTVKIVRESDNADVASVSVPMVGGTNGEFKYVSLSSAVTLDANTNYYVVSEEANGMDQWYDSNTEVAPREVATVSGRVSSSNGTTWDTSGATPGTSYGPVDFIFDDNGQTSLGVNLSGKLDFSNVGLFGHSRGGQGVRAAYNLYREAGSVWPARILNPVTFKGIFEVGPTDFETNSGIIPRPDSKYIADGTKWNVLLPMCDMDISDLVGMNAYDRMLLLTVRS